MSTPDELMAKLEQLLAVDQRERRFPAIPAAVLRDGKLEARSPSDAAWEPRGSVTRMVWAGYPVTREPGPWRAP